MSELQSALPIETSKLSQRNQIVVPSMIRKSLRLKPGKRLVWRLIYINDRPKVLAEPEPQNWAQYTRGLGKHLWENTNIDEYISNLRREWETAK